MNERTDQQVVVTDIRMPFLSMVFFMVKWAIAAIPAVVILIVISTITWTVMAGLLFSAAFMGRSVADSATSSSASLPQATSAAQPTADPSTSESAAYLSRVTVTGARVGGGIMGKGVFGEVKNNGDRVLSRVQITVYFLDKSKRPISEKTYHPVFVSTMSMDRDANQPLKPGYSRKFGVDALDAPSDWGGDVEVKVTSVAFGDGAL